MADKRSQPFVDSRNPIKRLLYKSLPKESDLARAGTSLTTLRTTSVVGAGSAHSALTDMPSATNSDHDGRYYTETEIGSTANGEGASLVGIEDSAGHITATDVEGALAELAPLTTKGDLYTFSSAPARLAVGTNNYVLHADSAETTGIKWAQLLALIVNISDAGGYYTSGNVEGALQEIGDDLGAKPLHEQHWALTHRETATFGYTTSVNVVASPSIGGSSGLTVTHPFDYDFTDHEFDYNYTQLACLAKVTVLISDPEWIGNWDNATEAVFWDAFRKVGSTCTVRARIRRSGSTDADAVTRLRIVLSDNDGSHSTSDDVLVSAVGTSWEDLELDGIDVSSYGTELQWALEITTDGEPEDSINATSTIQVHHIEVTQV